MTPTQRKWLELVAMSSGGGSMYAGQRQDLIPPKVARWMEREGVVHLEVPRNPSHKERFVISQAGRDALAAETE